MKAWQVRLIRHKMLDMYLSSPESATRGGAESKATMGEGSEAKRVRVVLLDDNALFRASLGRLLAAEDGFDVVGECATAQEAIELLAASAVDLVLLEFDLTTGQGVEFIPMARQAGYQGKFLAVTAGQDARDSAVALKLGASGAFLKSESPARLVQALRLVASGDLWVDQKIIRLLAERYPQYEDRSSASPLTTREHKVLQGILAGRTNRKIGEELSVSEGSVKATVQQLFGKAGVRTRGQLVRMALEGLFGTVWEVAKPPK